MVANQSPSSLFETPRIGEDLGSAHADLGFMLLDGLSLLFGLERNEQVLQVISSLLDVKGVSIFVIYDSLSPLVVLALLLVLDDEGEEHVGVAEVDALPLVYLLAFDFAVEQEADVPQP